jgi:antitoxin component of RelBE/YafQ-DinJ toxin-antitoxin module
MARTQEVSVRVTADERRLFDQVAERDGLALSSMLRNLVSRRAQEQKFLPVYQPTPQNRPT